MIIHLPNLIVFLLYIKVFVKRVVAVVLMPQRDVEVEEI